MKSELIIPATAGFYYLRHNATGSWEMFPVVAWSISGYENGTAIPIPFGDPDFVLKDIRDDEVTIIAPDDCVYGPNSSGESFEEWRKENKVIRPRC
jgi:hypothetical protein